MDVLMPQLGETVSEGTVGNWRKQVGDRVAADEIIVEIETDKVSMEIPAPRSGTLAKILVATGQTVAVGTVLAVVEDQGAAAASASGVSSAAVPPAATAAPPAAPRAADAAGAAASAATGASAPRPAAARSAEAAPATAGNGATSPRPAATTRTDGQRLSPAVRRLVAEHALDLGSIVGTGRSGRVTRRNVIDFLEQGAATAAPANSAAARAPAPAHARPATGPAGPGTTVPFGRIRRLTADHMVKSKATSPHVLQAVEVDFGGVDRVRQAARDSWKARHGYSLTYLPFIAHSACRALGEFPHLNASVEGDALRLHPQVNLAIAVDLGADGLVAPVIRAAQSLSVTAIAGAIHDVAGRARAGRLKPDDLAGGTYTLSNSGTFGTLITAPIINQPQVAILSTDGVRKKPVVIERPEGDSIAIRPIGILAQSFDHRAVDGAYSAAFLDRVRKLIETTDWFRET